MGLDGQTSDLVWRGDSLVGAERLRGRENAVSGIMMSRYRKSKALGLGGPLRSPSICASTLAFRSPCELASP